MSQLSWEDLFTDASHLDFERLFAEWPGLVSGSVRPIGASAFGDLFFERRTGGVEKLDVLEGGLHPVAASFEEFSNLMNSADWQKVHLLSNGVALLKDKGVSKTQAQFFGFAPHPSLAGKIVWSSVLPLDAIVWHSICAQTLGGPAPSAAPPGDLAGQKKPWWKAR